MADKQLDERYYMPKYSSGQMRRTRSNILFVFLIIIYYHGQPGVIRRGKAAVMVRKSLFPDFHRKGTIKSCNNNILNINSAAIPAITDINGDILTENHPFYKP
jgi:hypothetical protein